jgi:hypothetical protein
MPIDDRTTNRSYKLPNAGNFLADDVQRLRDALTAIDADIFARYTKTETDQKLADLINGAPGALDTLNELAAAMGNDPNFAATITNALAGKPGFADVWTRTQADARYVQGVTQTENVFTGNGSQTTFALSQTPPTRESLLVTVDGVVQPVSEYNLSGSALILSEAPASGSKIRVLMLGVAGPVQSASTLSFTQAGTGAVTRTVDSKLKDLISVKDFGAVGDGVADDTAAIQAAINAARTQNSVVYFPPNNTSQIYKITAPLTCNGPISIIGAGPQAVTIWAQGFSAGQFILDFNLPAATNYFFDIHGITLRSNNGAPNGLRLKNTSYCTIKNLQIYNVANGVEISGSNCFSNFFENLACYQVSGRSVRFASFTGGGHYTFSHCTFTGNYGFEVDSASGITQLAFVSCNFEQCVSNSFYTLGTVQGLSFVGCRTEGLDGSSDFLIYPSAGNKVTGLSVTGCYFTTDAGASVPIYLGGNSGPVRGFQICGNHVEYAAASNFVTLNGDGESGLIAGNYFNLTTTTPTNVRRPGVVVYGNENGSGKCTESWGNANWGIEEGSFTPSWQGVTVTGNTVPRNNVGRYRRAGNMVTVWILGDYVLNSYTTKPTGQVRISNLPFVAASDHITVEFPATATRVTHSMPIFGALYGGSNSLLLFEEANNLLNSPTALDWTAIRDPFGNLSMQFSYRI